MPRIKRWFPVSHDINGDPEVIELTEKFDLPGLKIWLQLLSIGDRNEGQIPGEIEYICKSLLFCFTSNSRRYGTEWRLNRCKMVLEWMQDKHWIETKRGAICLSNYLKYHRTREHEKVPSEPDPTGPDLIKTPISPPSTAKKQIAASPAGFAEFWNLYPKKKSKGSAEKAWRQLKPDADLQKKIYAGVARGRSSHDWLKQGGQFIPHPATWLRAKGWEDQGVTFTVVKNNNGHSAAAVVPQAEAEKPTDEQIERSRQFLKETISQIAGKMGVA